MNISVAFKPSAHKQFSKLSPDIRKRIAEKIDALCKNPFPFGCQKLSGEESFYRIRVGNYRVIYWVDDSETPKILILVVEIGHRREVYR